MPPRKDPSPSAGKGNLTITFRLHRRRRGNNKLNLAGVQLLSAQGAVLDSDFHPGATGDSSTSNTYKVKVPARGGYMLRYWAETKTEPIASKGEITFSLPVTTAEKEDALPADSRMAQGVWSRKTTLQPREIWNVSSVIGLFAPGAAAQVLPRVHGTGARHALPPLHPLQLLV